MKEPQKRNPKQNITLSIPRDVLRKAKHIAIERDTSLSGLLTSMLEDLVAKEDAYELSKQRQLTLLEEGLDLGTNGKITWNREELHER